MPTQSLFDFFFDPAHFSKEHFDSDGLRWQCPVMFPWIAAEIEQLHQWRYRGKAERCEKFKIGRACLVIVNQFVFIEKQSEFGRNRLDVTA